MPSLNLQKTANFWRVLKRHPCVFYDSRGYSSREKKEQHELLTLMSEVGQLRQGNYRRERKLRKMEIEMDKVEPRNGRIL